MPATDRHTAAVREEQRADESAATLRGIFAELAAALMALNVDYYRKGI